MPKWECYADSCDCQAARNDNVPGGVYVEMIRFRERRGWGGDRVRGSDAGNDGSLLSATASDDAHLVVVHGSGNLGRVGDVDADAVDAGTAAGVGSAIGPGGGSWGDWSSEHSESDDGRSPVRALAQFWCASGRSRVLPALDGGASGLQETDNAGRGEDVQGRSLEGATEQIR